MLVQKATVGFNNSAAQQSLAYANPVTAGDLLVVFIATFNAGVTVTVSDTLGNTYLQASGYITATENALSCWYCISAFTGSNTVQFTPNSTAYSVASILEYSGIQPSPLDGTASNSSHAGISNSPTTGTIPVSGTGELLIAAFAVGGNTPTFTPGGGFALQTSQLNGFVQQGLYVEDISGVSSGRSATGTFSVSSNYVGLGVSFKAVALVPPASYAPEVRQGPPLRGAPWVTTLPGVPPSIPVPPPAPQNTSLLKYAPEIYAGPPLRGAPWVRRLPVTPTSVQGPPMSPPLPQIYAAEIRLGPAMRGAPWVVIPETPPPTFSPPVIPVPPSPIPKLPGNFRAFVPRAPHNDRRLARHTEIVADILNSGVGQGVILQISPNGYRFVNGGFFADAPPTAASDLTIGAVPGCSWVDSTAGKIWFCINNSPGSAIWRGPF